MRVTALNLPDELVARLDSFAAADGRSRSGAARVFLEAALNADEALRLQADNHFYKLQTPGCSEPQNAVGRGASVSAFSPEVPQDAGALSHRPPGRDEVVEFTPASSLQHLNTEDFKMPVNDPHAQLKADALRTAGAGILARLYPPKDLKPKEDK